MNWKTISMMTIRIASVLAGSMLIALAAMYSFITFFPAESYSDGKVIMLGIVVFFGSLIGLGLHAYNLANEFRRRAKRRKRTEKRRKMTVDEYEQFSKEIRKQMNAAMKMPVQKASSYDLHL